VPEPTLSESEYRLTDRSEERWETSSAYKSLKEIQANPRVKYVVVIVPGNACPACQNLVGTYPKDQAPRLPVESCSHPLGCRSFYMPYLDEIYP
jgi:hypothetical protein